MQWSTIGNLPAAKLAILLDVEAESRWDGEDPATILRHQLNAPLLPDLLFVPGTDSTRLQWLVQERPPAETFMEHLLSTNPSMELLQAIKAFSRHIGEDTTNPLHGDPASIIYFAAIAAALVQCHSRITSLNDAAMRKGFQWVSSHSGASDFWCLIDLGLAMIEA